MKTSNISDDYVTYVKKFNGIEFVHGHLYFLFEVEDSDRPGQRETMGFRTPFPPKVLTGAYRLPRLP